MAFGITTTGYTRPTTQDLLTQAENALKSESRFGDTISFDSNSTLYQMFSVICATIANAEERIEQVYYAGTVNTSEGVPLDNVVKYAGISRKQGARSTGTVTFSGVTGTVIATGFQVQTTGGIVFTVDSSVTIGAGGTVDANITALNVGTQGDVADATITVVTSPQTGVSSVTNASDTTGGQNRETDEELRGRYAVSVSQGTGNTVDSIKAEIDAVTGVLQSEVIENDTNATVGGVPAKAISSLVQGGNDNDIANAIFATKPGGIQAFGSTVVVVTDSQGNNHNIGFSRPTPVDVWYRITKTTSTGYPTDGDDQIEAAVIAFGTTLGIGEDVYPFGVSSAITDLNLVGLDNIVVELSSDGVTYNTNPVVIADASIATTDSGKVSVV